MSPFVTLYIAAWCGACEWGEHVNGPLPVDEARVIRRARRHERDTGHTPVAIERGQVYYRQQ